LLAENRLAPEPASRAEINDLRAVVRRNLAGAQIKKPSDDGRFGQACDAARILANIIVRAGGYRVRSDGGELCNTFLALKAADPAFAKKAVYFDACRRERNHFPYEQAHVVSSPEARNFFFTPLVFPLKLMRGLKSIIPI
jgi:hypothetical protein